LEPRRYNALSARQRKTLLPTRHAVAGMESKIESIVYSRDQVIETFLFKHKVHVAWPPAMSAQLLQQLADRPIIGDRIGHRHNCLEPEDSVLVTHEYRSAVGIVAPVLILYVILALAVGLPDINLDAGKRYVSGGFDAA